MKPISFLLISSSIHRVRYTKRNFTIINGICLSDFDYEILAFETRANEATGYIEVLLPPIVDIDSILWGLFDVGGGDG